MGKLALIEAQITPRVGLSQILIIIQTASKLSVLMLFWLNLAKNRLIMRLISVS